MENLKNIDTFYIGNSIFEKSYECPEDRGVDFYHFDVENSYV